MIWPELREVKGQAGAKRALEIAAAGGRADGRPAGQRQVDAGAALRLAAAAADARRGDGVRRAAQPHGAGRAAALGRAPWRAPHHSASAAALVGGGSPPRPGEISLAHHGVCSWMNCRNFPARPGGLARTAGDRSRDDLACGAAIRLPCALPAHRCHEPRPCGHLGSLQRACRCSPDEAARYQSRLSGRCSTASTCRWKCRPVPLAALASAADGERARRSPRAWRWRASAHCSARACSTTRWRARRYNATPRSTRAVHPSWKVRRSAWAGRRVATTARCASRAASPIWPAARPSRCRSSPGDPVPARAGTR